MTSRRKRWCWRQPARLLSALCVLLLATACGGGSSTRIGLPLAPQGVLPSSAIRLVLPSEPVESGSLFTVPVELDADGAGVSAYGLSIQFVPEVLHLEAVAGAAVGPLAGRPTWNGQAAASGHVELFGAGTGEGARSQEERTLRLTFRANSEGGVTSPLVVAVAHAGGLVTTADWRTLTPEAAGGLIEVAP